VIPPTDERGGAPAVEAAIVAGILGLLVAFTVAGVRVAAAESATEQAARAAARIASIQRQPASAATVTADAAREALSARGVRCIALDVGVEVNGTIALGAAAEVRAEVVCDVPWPDLGIPGVPGTRRSRATATSSIDPLRER
jgi:Flp pilus assembly protein TadG